MGAGRPDTSLVGRVDTQVAIVLHDQSVRARLPTVPGPRLPDCVTAVVRILETAQFAIAVHGDTVVRTTCCVGSPEGSPVVIAVTKMGVDNKIAVCLGRKHGSTIVGYEVLPRVQIGRGVAGQAVGHDDWFRDCRMSTGTGLCLEYWK